MENAATDGASEQKFGNNRSIKQGDGEEDIVGVRIRTDTHRAYHQVFIHYKSVSIYLGVTRLNLLLFCYCL